MARTLSDSCALALRNLRRQVLEKRIRPGPRSAIARPDRPVACCLDPQRQPEDLDEANCGRVVERVALVVRCEAPVVERERGTAAGDDRIAVVQPNPDLAGYDALRRGDVATQVAVERAEPQAVV